MLRLKKVSIAPSPRSKRQKPRGWGHGSGGRGSLFRDGAIAKLLMLVTSYQGLAKFSVSVAKQSVKINKLTNKTLALQKVSVIAQALRQSRSPVEVGHQGGTAHIQGILPLPLSRVSLGDNGQNSLADEELSIFKEVTPRANGPESGLSLTIRTCLFVACFLLEA